MKHRNRRLSALLIVPGAAGLLMSGAAQAAEEQSWICQYLPSACGSESDPGGLPGHAGSGGSSSDTRGLEPEAESAPAPAAPAPAEPQSPPPQTEDEKKGY